MKTYNIGVTTQGGENIGYIVSADNADRAYERAVNDCTVKNVPLMPGHLAQRREDREGYNEYFDRTYPTRVWLL